MHDKLLIFQKTYALLLWIYPLINRIPKSHRLVLGKVIEERAISLLITITKANKSRGSIRQELQHQISDDLDTIRILLRLTKDLRFVSVKQYIYGAEKVNEIAKILTAWRKVIV